MRDVFVKTLREIASYDEKLVLLMAEVGFGVVEPFEKDFPDRFYNTGISEQNLVLTACGMAVQGMRPVAYSMSSFLPTRAFEMIKDSVCYQDLPVTLVGIGSGFSYGKLGTTHHAIEESALMRCLPNMTVIFPADADECRAALKWSVSSGHPCYIGLEKVRSIEKNEICDYSPEWKVYKTDAAKEGEKVVASLIACGYLAENALETQRILAQENINIDVYSAQTVKPLDKSAITQACKTKNILVLDEHSLCAGFAADIAQEILLSGNNGKIQHYEVAAIPDKYPDKIWDEHSMRKNYGMDSQSLVERIRGLL